MPRYYWEVYLDPHRIDRYGFVLPDMEIHNALIFLAEQGSPVCAPSYRHVEVLGCYLDEGLRFAFLNGFMVPDGKGGYWHCHDYPNPADGWPAGWRRVTMSAAILSRFLSVLKRHKFGGTGKLGWNFDERGISKEDLAALMCPETFERWGEK